MKLYDFPTQTIEYSTAEVAHMTNKSADTVRLWIRQGKLKARKPMYCRDYIIRKSDFDEFWYGKSPS